MDMYCSIPDFAGNADNWDKQAEFEDTPSQHLPRLSSNVLPYSADDTIMKYESLNLVPAQRLGHPQQNNATRPQMNHSNNYYNYKYGDRLNEDIQNTIEASSSSAQAQQQSVTIFQQEPNASASKKAGRTWFLDILPEDAYAMPQGSQSLQFTMVDILVILPNWYKQQQIVERLMNNGLSSKIHIAILQSHMRNAQDLSQDGVKRASAGITDLYRKSMRKLTGENWTLVNHIKPSNWNTANINVSKFVPDQYRIKGFATPESINFKDLANGLTKLPHGPDAGDLTRALEWAMSNQKYLPDGQTAELKFPDDIHAILNQIGYTSITADHTDSAINDRYRRGETRTFGDLTAGTPAPLGERSDLPEKERISDSDHLIPQLPRTQMATSYSMEGLQSRVPHQPQNQMVDPQFSQSSQQQPARKLGSSFLSPVAQQQVPLLSPTQTASDQLSGSVVHEMLQRSPERTVDYQFPGGMVEATFSQNQFSIIEQNLGWQSPTLGDFEVIRSQAQSTTVFPPQPATLAAEWPLVSRVDRVTGISEINFEDVTNMAPLSPGTTANIQDTWARLCAEAAEDNMTPLEAIEQANNLGDSWTPSLNLEADDGELTGTLLENPYAYLNDLPFANNTKYPDTMLLRDCAEADNSDDHSPLARAAKWCKRHDWLPYRIGHVEHVLEMDEIFGDMMRP